MLPFQKKKKVARLQANYNEAPYGEATSFKYV